MIGPGAGGAREAERVNGGKGEREQEKMEKVEGEMGKRGKGEFGFHHIIVIVLKVEVAQML